MKYKKINKILWTLPFAIPMATFFVSCKKGSQNKDNDEEIDQLKQSVNQNITELNNLLVTLNEPIYSVSVKSIKTTIKNVLAEINSENIKVQKLKSLNVLINEKHEFLKQFKNTIIELESLLTSMRSFCNNELNLNNEYYELKNDLLNKFSSFENFKTLTNLDYQSLTTLKTELTDFFKTIKEKYEQLKPIVDTKEAFNDKLAEIVEFENKYLNIQIFEPIKDHLKNKNIEINTEFINAKNNIEKLKLALENAKRLLDQINGHKSMIDGFNQETKEVYLNTVKVGIDLLNKSNMLAQNFNQFDEKAIKIVQYVKNTLWKELLLNKSKDEYQIIFNTFNSVPEVTLIKEIYPNVYALKNKIKTTNTIIKNEFSENFLLPLKEELEQEKNKAEKILNESIVNQEFIDAISNLNIKIDQLRNKKDAHYLSESNYKFKKMMDNVEEFIRDIELSENVDFLNSFNLRKDIATLKNELNSLKIFFNTVEELKEAFKNKMNEVVGFAYLELIKWFYKENKTLWSFVSLECYEKLISKNESVDYNYERGFITNKKGENLIDIGTTKFFKFMKISRNIIEISTNENISGPFGINQQNPKGLLWKKDEIDGKITFSFFVANTLILPKPKPGIRDLVNDTKYEFIILKP